MDLCLANEVVSHATTRDVLSVLHDHVKAVAIRGRGVIDVGPFRVFLSRSTRDPAMSVAVPRQAEAGAGADTDWSASLDRLALVLRDQGRAVHLQCFAELFPALTDTLARRGCDNLTTQAAMSLARADLTVPKAGLAVRICRLGNDDQSVLHGLMTLQRRCAETPAPDDCQDDWLAQIRRDMAIGRATAYAAIVEGEVVGGALLVEGGKAAELVGVVTDPTWRRRRIASSLCGRLLAERFAAEDSPSVPGGGCAWLPWLSVGSLPATALYRRLGFRRVGTRLAVGVGDMATD